MDKTTKGSILLILIILVIVGVVVNYRKGNFESGILPIENNKSQSITPQSTVKELYRKKKDSDGTYRYYYSDLLTEYDNIIGFYLLDYLDEFKGDELICRCEKDGKYYDIAFGLREKIEMPLNSVLLGGDYLCVIQFANSVPISSESCEVRANYGMYNTVYKAVYYDMEAGVESEKIVYISDSYEFAYENNNPDEQGNKVYVTPDDYNIFKQRTEDSFFDEYLFPHLDLD